MTSRRTVLHTAGTVAVVASPGCAAPLAASDGENGDGGGDENGDAVADETLVAVADEDGEVEAITHDHVASVDDVRRHRQGDGYVLPITLTDGGVDSLAEALRTAGALAEPERAEIRFYFGGELQQTLRLGPHLAATIREGEFEGEFLLQVESHDEAEALREELTVDSTGTAGS